VRGRDLLAAGGSDHLWITGRQTEVQVSPAVRLYGKLGTLARRLHVNDVLLCVSTEKALANYR
jgi:hypothetical protein